MEFITQVVGLAGWKIKNIMKTIIIIIIIIKTY
jgi:hypothetical protein